MTRETDPCPGVAHRVPGEAILSTEPRSSGCQVPTRRPVRLRGRRGRTSVWLVAPWPDSAQTQEPLLAEEGSAFLFAALEEPGPEEASFLDCRETLVMTAHCFGPSCLATSGGQSWPSFPPHGAHSLRQPWRAVPSVALGRWRKESEPIWVLLSLGTLGSKEEDLPSSPARRW